MTTFEVHPIRKFLRWVLIAVASMAVLYLSFAVWLWNREATVTRDCRKRFLLCVPSVAPFEAAWPRYQVIDERFTEYSKPVSSEPQRRQTDLLNADPGTALWPLLYAILEEHQADMTELREIAALPQLGRFAVEKQNFNSLESLVGAKGTDFLYGAVNSHLGMLRGLHRLLMKDAYAAAEDGNGSRAVADLQASIGIAKHAQQSRSELGSMVSCAITTSALFGSAKTIRNYPSAFSDDDLACIRKSCAEIRRAPMLRDQTAQRLFIEAVCEMYFGDGDEFLVCRAPVLLEHAPLWGSGADSDWLGSKTVSFLLGPCYYFGAPTKHDVLSLWLGIADEVEEQSAFPNRLQDTSFRDELDARLEHASVCAVPYKLIEQYVGNVRNNSLGPVSRVYADMLSVLVAAEQYRRAHGAYPKTLAVMVPEFLESIPLDPWAMGPPTPLHYEAREEGTAVWSVAEDGFDDGGPPRPPRVISQGDWYMPRLD